MSRNRSRIVRLESTRPTPPASDAEQWGRDMLAYMLWDSGAGPKPRDEAFAEVERQMAMPRSSIAIEARIRKAGRLPAADGPEFALD